MIFTQEEIDAEAERLASLPRPANGRRESLFVHPRSTEPGLGLLPGIRVTLSVLRPGERTEPLRRNSTEVEFCIRGGGSAVVGRKRIAFSQYDVWNHPSWHAAWQVNDADELQVRLTYSNAPLLEKMNVHVVDENPSVGRRIIRSCQPRMSIVSSAATSRVIFRSNSQPRSNWPSM